MTRFCAASGCIAHAVGYSVLCSRHRGTQARHGHPNQTAVTVHELRPYRRKVAERRKANPDSPAWRILETYWARVLASAQETLAAWEAGRGCIKHEVQAAYQLQAIAGAVSAAVVVEAALGMVLLWSADPRRFRSDRAFDHQLVRRVRGLASTAAGSYWNAKTQRVSKVYKDLPPRTVQVLAAHLKGAFGAAGVRLAELDVQKAEAAQHERERLQQAFLAMR